MALQVRSSIAAVMVEHPWARQPFMYIFSKIRLINNYVIIRKSYLCLFIITFNKFVNEAEYDSRQGSRHNIIILVNSFI